MTAYTPEELATEVWRTVPGFNWYTISNLGRLYACERMAVRMRNGKAYDILKKGCIVNATLDSCGYPQVKLYVQGGGFKSFKLHKVVALAFLDNPENLPYINHRDGDKTNPRLSNLERCTAQQNTRHAWDTGLCTAFKGEKHGSSKLKDADIPVIRKMILDGFTYLQIGEHFGVTGTNIYYIDKDTTWRHIA